MKARTGALAALALALAMVTASCADASVAAARAARAAAARGDIVIGAGGPWGTAKGKAVMSGIELALAELNAEGGVLGRRLRLERGDDHNSAEEGRKVAQAFAADLDVVAVIGHLDSFVSLPTSVMYQFYGLVMVSPISTSPRLTRQGFARVFRTIPDDTVFGARMARLAGERGSRAAMIYQVRNAYGTGIANAFEKECEALGIAVPDRLSYDSSARASVFRRDLAYWRDNFGFDSIFVAGSIPLACDFVREARAMGIGAEMLAGESLDSPEFPRIAGEGAEGAFVGSTFIPGSPRPQTRAFVAAYKAAYGAEPDAKAAQGYDTLRVIARAIALARSAVPDEIARALRGMEAWEGATGPFAFDAKGDLSGREIAIKTVREGRFEAYQP